MSFTRKFSYRDVEPDAFLVNPPFPLVGATLGLIAVVNVTSAMVTLLSL